MSAALSIDWIRGICMALPHVTETVQWGDDLVFKVGGKMFAVAPLEPAKVCLSFKCTKEGFDELVERPGVIPAPYLARAYWVSLEEASAMPKAEVRRRLEEAHAIVFAGLPKKTRAALHTGTH
jgi:predicted DNA-binding protein (MmcQ/YjbR family)